MTLAPAAAQADWLSSSRIAPPPAPRCLVARERLDETLALASSRAVTLVVAPAGSGKSIAVANWSRRRAAGRVAWVTIEPGTDPAATLWADVLAALRACTTVPADARLHMLRLPPTGVDAGFAQALVNAVATLPRRVVLVIDDLHLVEDPVTLGLLEFLIAHPPPQLGVVLVARRDPDLAMGRLRSQDQVADLRAAELAFTTAEVSELLTDAEIELGAEDVAALCTRTEGWAAGLGLAAQSLRTEADPSAFVRTFAGGDRAVSDYLAEEVLAHCSTQERSFLLHVSAVDRVNGELAEVLTGQPQGAARLQALAMRNVFIVELAGQPGWFRFHTLLLELLRVHLRFSAHQEIRELHQRAAGWFADRGLVLDALHHADQADDWALVSTVLGRHWLALFLDGETAVAERVLRRIPSAVLEDDPQLALPRAAAALARGEWTDVDRYLDLALRLADRVPGAHRDRFAQACAVVRVHRARLLGDIRGTLGHARELLALPGAADDQTLLAVGLLNAGVGQLWRSGVADACADLEDAVQAARRSGRELVVVVALGMLALAELDAGRLAAAHALADEAVELARHRGWSELPQMAIPYAVLAGNHHLWGQPEPAGEWRERCRTVLQTASDPFAATVLALLDAQAALSMGDPAEARQALRRGHRTLERHGNWRWLVGPLHALEARALLGLGDVTGARELQPVAPGAAPARDEAVAGARTLCAEGLERAALDLLDLEVAPASHVRWGIEIEGALVEAMAGEHLGDRDRAGAAVERALELVERERPVQLVLDHGPSVRGLLERHARRGTAHRGLLDEVLARLGGGYAGPAPDPLDEALTARELAVLRYLPTAMSVPEIASEMFLSPNTVRTHVKRIYRKLEVGQRRAAIERASELRLIGRGGRG